MRKLRKPVSVLLSFVMILGMLTIIPVTSVGAAESVRQAVGGTEDHTHDGVTFAPWEGTTSLPTSGDYYLTENVEVTSLTNVSGTLRLCLNGKTVTYTETGNNPIFYVSGGATLDLYDNEGGGVLTGGKGYYDNGGAVYNYREMGFYGGSITNNSSSQGGGGIYLAPNTTKESVLKISGSPVITGNTYGSIDSNITLRQASKYIKVVGELTNTTPIGVAMGSPDVFTTGLFGNGTIANFKSDYDGFTLVEESGEAKLTRTVCTITWKDRNGDVLYVQDDVLYDSNIYYEGPAPEAYYEDNGRLMVFDGWTPELGQIKGDTTFTAKYTDSGDMSYYIYIEDTSVDPSVTYCFNDVTGSSKVKLVKSMLSDVTNVAIPSQVLVLPKDDSEEVLLYDDDTTLEDYGVEKGDTLRLSRKTLIPKKKLTLDGNITINFYVDPLAANLLPSTISKEGPKDLEVTFEWAEDCGQKSDLSAYNTTVEVNTDNFSELGDTIEVNCAVCAAEMSCDIKVTAKLNGVEETQLYSVRDYCKVILDEDSKNSVKYIEEYGTNKYSKLRRLIVTMLDYGAKTQKVFGIMSENEEDLANSVFSECGIDYTMGDVDDSMFTAAIKAANDGDTADDMNEVAASVGANWYTTSVYFLQYNRIRHVFTKANDDFDPSDYPEGNSQYDYYYWVETPEDEGIPAAELDDLQTFTIGNDRAIFRYSVLDYAMALAKSTKNSEEQRDLAKAVYWYNRAANKFFDEDPSTSCIVDLGELLGDYEAQDGDVLTGTLSGNYKITVADGATVTLRDADITSLENDYYDGMFAGITLTGDATLVLDGENTVKGGYDYCTGIEVPENATLTINGTGSLEAYSGGYGCGIGSPYSSGASGGNVVIESGTVNAIGGKWACGIGINYGKKFGSITITGGNVTATGGQYGSGIGCTSSCKCGDITISGGTVTAVGGDSGVAIGAGSGGKCGDILITSGVTHVTATAGSGASASIGAANQYAECGTVTIEDESKVTQN